MSQFGGSLSTTTNNLTVQNSLTVNGTVNGELICEDRNPKFNTDNEGTGSFGITWGYPTGGTNYFGGLYYDATNSGGEFALFNKASSSNFSNQDDLTLTASNFAPLNVSQLNASVVEIVGSGGSTGGLMMSGTSNYCYIPNLYCDNLGYGNSSYGGGSVFASTVVAQNGISATTGYFSGVLTGMGTGYFAGGLSSTTGYFSSNVSANRFYVQNGYWSTDSLEIMFL